MAVLVVSVLVELMYTFWFSSQVSAEYDPSDSSTTVVHFESEYTVIVTVVEVAVTDAYVDELVG